MPSGTSHTHQLELRAIAGPLHRLGRRLSAVAALLLALAALAFWPAYLSRLPAGHAAQHVHAILGTTWLLLLVSQPWLLRSGRRMIHRRLGWIGVLVGIAFVASSVRLAHHGLARMDAAALARDGAFVYLPLAMAVIFALALGLAVRWRAVPAMHARFMALTTLPLLDPMFARLTYQFGPRLPVDAMYQLPAFVVIALVLTWMLRSLPADAPGRPAMRGFAVATAVLLLGFFVVPATSLGLAFAAWFRGLPLS